MPLTPDQLALRRSGIGSSDIPALLGVDPFWGPMDVYVSKTMDVERASESEAPTGRNPIRWGHRLEPIIVAEWARIVGIEAWTTPGTLRHRDVTIALATPDAIAMDHTRGCEAKAVGLRAAGDWQGDAAPARYSIQCQWQMGVCEVDHWDLCALIGGQDFQIRHLDFDRTLFDKLLAVASRFWSENVVPRVPPALDAGWASAAYLREHFPIEKAPMVKATPEMRTLAQAVATWSATKREADRMEREARNQLCNLIGAAAGIEGICTWKMQKAQHYTVDRQAQRVLRLFHDKDER